MIARCPHLKDRVHEAEVASIDKSTRHSGAWQMLSHQLTHLQKHKDTAQPPKEDRSGAWVDLGPTA